MFIDYCSSSIISRSSSNKRKMLFTRATFHNSFLKIGIRYVSNAPSPQASPLEVDMVIAGGGIVGCATARRLKIEYPNLKICMVEKENTLGVHQTGNNSGVIHAGIYYTPGTLKAKLCVEGMDLAYKFFTETNFPHKKVGKLIVAVEPEEIPRLDILYERSQKNGCKDIQVIEGSRIKEYEPHCKGLKALWSPHTGIVEWGEVAKALAIDFEKKGGTVYVNFPVRNITESSNPSFPIAVQSTGTNVGASRLFALLCQINTRHLITCCGLHSDRIAQLTGCKADPKIIPFRGEYLLLKPEKRGLVRTNIYPVPVPGLPFLGVHFTPRMNGDIWLGPNAVLAFKREGYNYFSISPSDLYDSLTYRGFIKLMTKYTKYGLTELYRGIWINAQVKQLQRFIPDLKLSDVIRGPAGVRAQAMDLQGNLVDDFVFDSGTGPLSKHVLHVRNAPSPGATSSLAIAKMIAKEAKSRFAL
ncbi:FAD dependent oxidoreductase [Dictyocaulus viviparus]|uniref:L-2-hydroxyglutarate dehydrogenase, mitochondrial n=1 Tax=Dictyocaulus viviparus TaxID=29172 RepID=A0A0D8Y651_DICVI|nr:FAD dependent oxidoreductase [Dictyocaulus viviparus]